THLAHLVHDLAMEFLVPVGFQHARHQLVLAVFLRGIADRALVLAELGIEAQRVIPLERREATGLRGGCHVHASGSPSWIGMRRAPRAGRALISMNDGTSLPNPVTDGPRSSSR